MTTSQQPRHGRHARHDEPGRRSSPASLPEPLPEPRSTPPVQRSVSSSDDAARPRSVGEYVAQASAPEPSEPAFGEWPYGKRKPEQEPVGPNPYLPCEQPPPDVRLAPGALPGTLALLAGVAGLGLALFPIIAIAVWPLTIIGIVLGVVGLRRIRAGSARNVVAVVSGVVLSAAGLVLCVVWLSMYAAAGVGTAETTVELGPVPAVVR